MLFISKYHFPHYDPEFSFPIPIYHLVTSIHNFPILNY